MNNDLRNNIKLYNDVLALRSTNFCRLKHIMNPLCTLSFNEDTKLGTYMFPCHTCEIRIGDTCMMPRLDLKVR